MDNKADNAKRTAEGSSNKPPPKKQKVEIVDASKPRSTELTSFTVSHQGMKAYQQDRAVSLNPDEVVALFPSLNDTRYLFYAVYDGHGGEFCSTYLQDHFHQNFFQDLTKGLGTLRNQDPEVLKVLEKRNKRPLRGDTIQKAIVSSCKSTDQALLKECSTHKHEDGSCAVAVLVEGETVWVCNVGDSRAVLGRRVPPATDQKEPAKDQKEQTPSIKMIPLSKDHTPVLLKEKQRIEKCGGFVDAEGRVCGRLAVSRSFGDLPVKKKGVVSQPDITKFTIKPGIDKFMILACDGLWSVFSSHDAVDFVSQEIDKAWQYEIDNPPKPVAVLSMQRKETPVEIVARKACKKLVAEAIEVRKAKDNTTAILILFGEPVP
eukprot:g75865.t1